jgi:hypothetical protein
VGTDHEEFTGEPFAGFASVPGHESVGIASPVCAAATRNISADDLDTAIRMAARIPAARLGGAIEVRPVGTYW